MIVKPTKDIVCRCGKTSTIKLKPATGYVRVTPFMCDCGKTYHIRDYVNAITTYGEVSHEQYDKHLKMIEDQKNRDRVRCSYPMSEFYIFEDEVPKDARVSTSEDCIKCDEKRGCGDSKHCLFEDSRHCLKLKPITAIFKQRSGDYHISVKDNSAIWDCGKTPKQAIDNFKRTAKSHNLEMVELGIDIKSITDITWIV